MSRTGAIAALAVVAAVIGAFGLASVLRPDRDEVAAVPIDGCMLCHSSPDHDPGGLHTAARVPCQGCHLGNPAGRSVDVAHVGLEREPGALDTAERTCGACHARELETVRRSLMATGRGIVAVDRWAFGEVEAPVGHESLADVLAATPPTPTQDHLRRLCAGCHLGTRAANRDDAVQGIGSGCSSCHTGTRTDGVHPAVDGVVPDARCMGCHSRSSRVALSYQGLAEIDPGAACDQPVTLFDGRSACQLEPDVHAAAGLGCTDCHVHSELMGDGSEHSRQRDATRVRCETCHGAPGGAAPGPDRPVAWGQVDDPISEAVVRLRGQRRQPEERVPTALDGTPLWHVRERDGRWWLEPKQGGEPLPVPATSAAPHHTVAGHERLACSSCHATWVPTCSTCHTRFDPAGEQWDFAAANVRPGRWVEAHVALEVGSPTLAVTPEDRIVPAAPGMIATLDATGAGGASRDLRVFSAFDPHTTTSTARGCADCHRSAVAIGLGRGSLEIDRDGSRFVPERPDGSGEASDRWVSPDARATGQATYPGIRSLDQGERERVLRVGWCLECHEGGAMASWGDFARAVDRGMGAGCVGLTGN